MNIETVRKRMAGKAGIFIWFTLSMMIVLAHAVTDLKLTGTAWSKSITSANLQGGAGSDLTTTYESATNQLLFEIAGTAGTKNWRIDVSRTDTMWHANFILSVRRTGGGDKPTQVFGGLTYLAVTTVAQAFFNGHDNIKNIPVQESLGGVSCVIPAASYSTTLTFTVVDTA